MKPAIEIGIAAVRLGNHPSTLIDLDQLEHLIQTDRLDVVMETLVEARKQLQDLADALDDPEHSEGVTLARGQIAAMLIATTEKRDELAAMAVARGWNK